MLAASVQQQFQFPRPRRKKLRTHGGKRRGAGRKPNIEGKPRLRHAARPAINARFPVHVTVRVRSDVPRLRRYELCAILRRAFVYGCRKDEFRICQFSIQANHIHLICEAADLKALASGIQGWKVRVARAVNRHCKRTGPVFDDRYHVEVLRTPTQTRHALCYVLQNGRRHGEVIEERWNGMDPFSSAWWFDGWTDDAWRVGLRPPDVRTVAEPQSWLLKVGWQRAAAGRIAIDEYPRASRWS